MAKKKKLVKIEVKEGNLQPNAIYLKDGEILSTTCDIYKFNLSKKNKWGQFVARDLGGGTVYEEDEFDFYLLRIKDSLLEKLEKKEITLLIKNDDDDEIEEITSFYELSECIDDFISCNCGELLFERYNKKDLVYFIPYLDSMI